MSLAVWPGQGSRDSEQHGDEAMPGPPARVTQRKEGDGCRPGPAGLTMMVPGKRGRGESVWLGVALGLPPLLISSYL